MHVPVDGTDETIEYPHPNREDVPRQAAADVDPDVERLVRVAYRALEGPIVDPDKAMTADEREAYTEEVSAVLADLRERYVLVPREDERVEWGVRSPHKPAYIGYAIDRQHAEELVASVRQGWEIVFRRTVYGPWEVAR